MDSASRTCDAARVAALTLELAALLFAITALEIGGAGYFKVAALAYGGALVRLALPHRWRLAWFVGLSAAGLFVVLGPQAAWVAAIGLAILGACRLPLPHAARALVLLAFGLALGAMRAGWWPAPWRAGLWPVVGSMFCFRTLAYLHDLRHEGRTWNARTELAYFFLLPNLGQALFPVIDFKAFRRTYDEGTSLALARRGVAWMTRGVLHIVAYRAIYLHATIPPEEVLDLVDLARHAASGFGLYLRLSGTFHLAVGMLLLFGWNLPPTHDRYFLAAGVNDLWRRINIYWKDLMQKLCFYPVYFRLRHGGPRTAVVVATASVVVATWFLHGLQWFWIDGAFPLRSQDVLFWGILGGLMAAGSLRELAPRTPRAAPTRPVLAASARAARVTATFAGMAILWSMWTSDSLAEWSAVWAVAGAGWAPVDASWMMAPMSLVLAVALLAMPAATRTVAPAAPPRAEPILTVPLALAGLVALGIPAAWTRLGPQAAELAASLREIRLNQIDAGRVQRGYYEDLLNASGAHAYLWDVGEAPIEMAFVHTPAARDTGDYRWKELAPYAEMTYHGRPFRTNAWGMRDRDYARAKPAHTCRIALLGASPEMGASVGDGETYEALVEDRLNRERSRATGLRYEILNFGCGQYSPIHRLMALESEALAFAPDAALYVAHPEDFDVEVWAVARAYAEGGALPPDPSIRALLDRAGLRPEMAKSEVDRRLAPHGRELETLVLARVAARCAARHVRPMWALLPSLGGIVRVRKALVPRPPPGFVWLDLSTVFDGHDPAHLLMGARDFHPNARAHRLIADRLYAELVRVGLPGEDR